MEKAQQTDWMNTSWCAAVDRTMLLNDSTENHEQDAAVCSNIAPHETKWATRRPATLPSLESRNHASRPRTSLDAIAQQTSGNADQHRVLNTSHVQKATIDEGGDNKPDARLLLTPQLVTHNKKQNKGNVVHDHVLHVRVRVHHVAHSPVLRWSRSVSVSIEMVGEVQQLHRDAASHGRKNAEHARRQHAATW